ncbi:MAG: hypothetical protein JNK15_08570 [Planctomycetes bacterium]|nr:hypothetical protein [Planctomycetota bacterium]
MLRALVVVSATTMVLEAQVAATLPHTVLVRMPAPVQSALAAVDPTTGVVSPLPTFASANLPPLALAQDPFDGALLVALDGGSGGSLVVRLVPNGGAYAEFVLGSYPAPVVALAVAGDQLLVGLGGPGGGVFAQPRRGGSGAMLLPQPNLAALHVSSPSTVTLAWHGVAGTGSASAGTATVDLATATAVWGPFAFPPTATAITGVVDLPTAVPRQLLAFADGSYALFTGILSQPPVPVATTPPLPNGGAAALRPAGATSIEGVAVGGVAFPFLYTIDAWTGQVVVRSGPLPGDPVDVAYGLSAQAHVLGFGVGCGPVPLAHGVSGLPQLGSTFAFDVVAPPQTVVFLAAGLDDFANGTLPGPLPGGCLLHVAPDVVLALVTDVLGTAVQPLAVPNLTNLLGVAVFTQWAHLSGTGFSLSAAFASRVGW